MPFILPLLKRLGLSETVAKVVSWILAGITAVLFVLWIFFSIYDAGESSGSAKATLKYQGEITKLEKSIEQIKTANLESIAKAKLDAALKAQADIAAAQAEAAKDAEVQRVADEQFKAAIDVLKTAPVSERKRKAPHFLVCAARGDCKR